MRYKVWIKGRREETEKIIDVPRYPDGGAPTPIRIRDTACKTIYFGWGDYTQIKFERYNNNEEVRKT